MKNFKTIPERKNKAYKRHEIQDGMTFVITSLPKHGAFSTEDQPLATTTHTPKIGTLIEIIYSSTVFGSEDIVWRECNAQGQIISDPAWLDGNYNSQNPPIELWLSNWETFEAHTERVQIRPVFERNEVPAKKNPFGRTDLKLESNRGVNKDGEPSKNAQLEMLDIVQAFNTDFVIWREINTESSYMTQTIFYTELNMFIECTERIF